MKVIVIGSGLTGLSAAWKLSKAGCDTEVIEMASRVGGMAASFKRNGYIFDYGTHGLHASMPANEEIVKEIKELLGDNLFPVQKKVGIWFLGKRFDYPLAPKDMLFNLNPIMAGIALLDFLQISFKKALGLCGKEDDYQHWVIHRFGKRLYQMYFGPYAEKLTGVHPSLLSASFAAQRISFTNLWEVLKRAFVKKLQRVRADEHPLSPYRNFFYSSHQGAGAISERLARHIIEQGGRITLNSRAVGVQIVGKKVRSVIIEQAGTKRELKCDCVLSTIPIKTLIHILFPKPPAAVITAADSLRYRALVLLYLLLNKERVSEYQWVYFSDAEFVFNRFSEFKNLSEKVAPSGKTSLCVEITCFLGDRIWNAENSEIYERSISAMETAGIVKKEEVEDYFVKRLPAAYPLWELGYEKHLSKVLDYLNGLENLYTGGRQGGFQYFTMDQSIAEGEKIAQKILTKHNTSRKIIEPTTVASKE